MQKQIMTALGANELLELIKGVRENGAIQEIARATVKKNPALKPVIGEFSKWSLGASDIWEIANHALLWKPEGHPLRVAVEALIAADAFDWPVWRKLEVAQPKRNIHALKKAAHVPTSVFALEKGATLSVWSVESGEKLDEQKLGTGKDDEIVQFVELTDGTIRCLTKSEGTVWEKAPGVTKFKKSFGIGKLSSYHFVANKDLSTLVNLENDGNSHRIAIALRETSAPVHVPIPDLNHINAMLVVGDRLVFAGWAWAEGDDGGEDSKLGIVDTKTGAKSIVTIEGKLLLNALAPLDEGHVRVRLEGDEELELDLATGKTKARAAQPDPAYDPYIAVGDLRWCGKSMKNANGETVSGFQVPDDVARMSFLYFENLHRVVVAGASPPMQLTVGLKASNKNAPLKAGTVAPAPAALDWARPGVKLTYAIADFDAEDEYEMEILEVGAELVVAVRMGESRSLVAERITFTEGALENGRASLALSQGHADHVDLDKPVKEKTPPFLVSRAQLTKLAAKKKAPYASSWVETKSIQGDGTTDASVTTSEGDRTVRCIVASGEDVALTVLDDARWPLVVNREEADCFLRIVSIDLRGAHASSERKVETAPSKSARFEPTSKGSTAQPSSTRRFELVEGASSKFWEIELAGEGFTVRYGRIGTNGQTQAKHFDSADQAMSEAEKLVREKTKKGYRQL